MTQLESDSEELNIDWKEILKNTLNVILVRFVSSNEHNSNSMV